MQRDVSQAASSCPHECVVILLGKMSSYYFDTPRNPRDIYETISLVSIDFCQHSLSGALLLLT